MTKRSTSSEEDGDVEVGSQSKRARYGDGGSASSPSFEKVVAYVKSVELADRSGLYPKFMLLLQDFRNRRIDVAALTLQVKKLFAHNQDLIIGFNMFLPDCCKIPLDEKTDEEEEEVESLIGCHHATAHSQPGCNAASVDDRGKEIKTRFYKQVANLCKKVENVLCMSDYEDLLMRNIFNYSREKITRDDLKAAVTNVLGSDRDRNLVKELTIFINAPEEPSSKMWRFEEEKKEVNSVYGQLDLSKCKRISDSYWLLPEAYCLPSNDEVLNDKFVCLSDENNSFKLRQLQQREEMLFRFEDYRYEMDLLIEYITSTIEKVMELLNAIEEKKVNLENGMKIEDHFSVFNRKCIERLYGEYGVEMMEVIKEKPIQALPVILKRLEQKEEELTKVKVDFNNYAKNLLKKTAVKQHKSSLRPLDLEAVAGE